MDRFAGEPTLEEVLSEPIVCLMMKADGLDMLRLCELLLKAGGYAAISSRRHPALRAQAHSH
jgi:hypothetical protein